MATTAALWASGTPSTTGTTWANPANAAGANNAGFATYTTATSGAVGTISCAGYGAQTAIGTQPESVDSVDVTVYGYVANTSRWTSVTVQLLDGSTPIGSAQTMTKSTSSTNSQTFTFTGVTWAQLANLGVRVTSTKSGTTSSVSYLDAAKIVITYSPVIAPAATASATAYAPTFTTGAVVVAPVATANGTAPTPTLTGAGPGVTVTPLTSADTGIGQFPGWTGTATGTTGSPATVESTSSGQVIEDLDIIGRIVIKHTNVVIRRCRLAVPPTASYYGVTIEAGNTGWVVEDCTIIGGTVTDLSADDGGYTGINASVSNGRVSRCDIERWENGVTISADSVLVEDTLITRSLPRIEDRGSAHTDCLEVYKGDGVAIVGNTLLCRDTSDAWLTGTSALMVASETGDVTNLNVSDNICGGGAYAVYFDAKTYVLAATVYGNAVMGSSAAYGPLYPDATASLTWGTDNVDVDATWTVIDTLSNPGSAGSGAIF